MCSVRDGLDRLPFDSGTLNTHVYMPQPVYELNTEITKMARFIEQTVKNSADGRNALWKYFGSARGTASPSSIYEDTGVHARLDQNVELLETPRDDKRTLGSSTPFVRLRGGSLACHRRTA